MRKKLIILIISLLFLVAPLYAQTSWSTGSYYAEQGQEQVICGNWYSVFLGYNSYGYPIYAHERQCKVEKWYSWYGTRYGYFWECNNYGCRWEYRSDTRYWYYFQWYYYTERS